MNPSHQHSLMAYYVPGVVLGAGYMVANKTKSLSWRTLCSTGHRGHRPFSIAGGGSDGGGSWRGGGQFVLRGRVELIPYLLPQRIDLKLGGWNNTEDSEHTEMNLRYEPLPLENCVLLKHLEVVFLICGMLVHYEDICIQFGDDKSQVKLTNDFHFCKHRFAACRKC